MACLSSTTITNKRKREEKRDWSSLPDLILLSVTLRLLSLHSLASFAAVCRHWRSFLRRSFRFPSPPLLLSPPPPTLTSSSVFLSSSLGHVIHLVASSHILISNPLSPAASLFVNTPLPSSRFPYYYAALTAPSLPSPRSLLLLFHSCNSFLYLSTGGPHIWSTYQLPLSVYVSQVITFKTTRTLAVNNTADKLLEFFYSQQNQELNVRIYNVTGINYKLFDKTHFGPQLVECGEDLVLLIFAQEAEKGDVVSVESYKLDFERMVWVEVKRLRDYAIYVDCAGKSAVACYRPQRWGEMSDCVNVAGPGSDTWVSLPIGGRRFLRYADNVTPVSARSMVAPRWPSPIWLCPTIFY